MQKGIKVGFVSIVTVMAFAGISGCGGGGDGGSPITASRISSTTVGGHTHTAEIPLSDVSGSPPEAVYQFRSNNNEGHSHVIALSRAQMTDLYNGERLSVTSSSPDAGADHKHSWAILGGNVLYDKYCYSCHGNSERGGKPMKVKVSSAQNAAIRNPAGAPLSNAPTATPDAAYNASTALHVQDFGTGLYEANCAPCHHDMSTTDIRNRSAAQIKSAIDENRGGMGFLGSLSDDKLAAIESALAER